MMHACCTIARGVAHWCWWFSCFMFAVAASIATERRMKT